MTKPQPNIKCSNCGYSWNTKSKLILVSCPSCKHNIKNTTITNVHDVEKWQWIECPKCRFGHRADPELLKKAKPYCPECNVEMETKEP